MSDFSTPYQVGEIVEILMGRDAGKLAVILKICNERYVSVVDGDKRKFDNPKTKTLSIFAQQDIFLMRSLKVCLKIKEFQMLN